MDWVDVGKYAVVYVVVPLGVWFYKRLDNKLEELDKRVSISEARHSVLDERVNNLRQDILEMKTMLRELLNRGS